MRYRHFFTSIFSIMLLIWASHAVAAQCPDLRNALPPAGWNLFEPSVRPTGHDSFDKAIITKNIMANVACTYTNSSGTVIIFKLGAYEPQSDNWGFCDAPMGIAQCCMGDGQLDQCTFTQTGGAAKK